MSTSTIPTEQADTCHILFRNAPSTLEFNKLRKRLIRQTREALETYSMLPTASGGRQPLSRGLTLG